jgi:hypothetical protein
MTDTTAGPVAPQGVGDDDFEDIEHELCASDREVSVGCDPIDDFRAFQATIRESHWAVPHGRLWPSGR